MSEEQQGVDTINEDEDENEQTLDQETNCPVCNCNLQLSDLMPHMMVHHPTIFMLWASYALPYTDFANFDEDEDPDWTHDYTYLSNLCDTIGYHKVGIEDINEVAPIVEKDKSDNEEGDKPLNDKCPICMEDLYKNEDDPTVRITISCKHGFCASCLEKWLAENKTCPICINWLAKESDTAASVNVLEEVD